MRESETKGSSTVFCTSNGVKRIEKISVKAHMTCKGGSRRADGRGQRLQQEEGGENIS